MGKHNFILEKYIFNKMGFNPLPGPKCSACCSIWSLICIIGLSFIALMIDPDIGGTKRLDNFEMTDTERHVATQGIWIAVLVYAGFVVLCGARHCYLKVKASHQPDYL